MDNISKDAKKIIEENPIAFATVNNTGKPNVIGVAYVKVVSKNQVLVTDNYMKRTEENLRKNNNVCLAVWGKDWNSYKLVGKAKYFASGKWKSLLKQCLKIKDYQLRAQFLSLCQR